MKKILSYLSLAVLALSIPLSTAFATTTCSTCGSNGYNAKIVRDAFNFKATLNSEGKVDTGWEAYAPDGFNYYKLVRSTKNPDPVYPEDGYIKYSADKNFISYTDTKVPVGTSYYRICSIAKPERYCSPVVTIVKGENTVSTAEPKEITPPEKTDTQTNPEGFAKLNLDAELMDGKVQLNWTTDRDVSHGFKIAKSYKNMNPTYPVMDGDSYKYLTDSTLRGWTDKDVIAGKTYYYRICQYNGSGTCLAYSNNVGIKIGDATGEVVNLEKIDESPDSLEFSDITLSPYKNSIQYVKNNKIVEGFLESGMRKYAPEKAINRAEFVKILVESKFGDEFSKSTIKLNCFNDVTGDWYGPYVCFAKNKGIIGGYPDNTYKPARDINFAEVSKILVNVYELGTEDESGEWYRKYVRKLEKNRYIPPTVNSVEKKLNRGEMAEMIWRIQENKTDEESNEILDKENFNGTSSNGETVVSGPVDGWSTFNGDGYSFSYPSSWYKGEKRGWYYLSEEKDYIDNLQTPYYMNVDTYIVTYKKAVDEGLSDYDALRIPNYFEHPFVEAKSLTINGMPALYRQFKAPSGTTVNGRQTHENEIITQYTYRNGGNVYVVQYFNARGRTDYNMDIFKKIAESVSK